MPHIFKSSAPKIILWCLLIFVLLLDSFGIWAVFINNAPVPLFLQLFMLLGVFLKIFLLGCLIMNAGPVRILLSIWGGMFVVSGVAGLLSFAISPSTEPIQAYIDKLLFFVMGCVIIYIAKEKIEYVEISEN